MSDQKGVGGLPDAGTIKPGAPGHIEDHDEMARLMQVAADTLGITLDPPAPPPAVIGENGHVDAHNTLLANIEQLAAAGGGGLPGELPGIGGWSDVTAVTGTGTKHEYTADGVDWSAFEWTADGSVTTNAGLVDAIVVGGGSFRTAAARFTSGRVNQGLLAVSASHTIEIGSGQTVENNDLSLGSGSSISDVLEQGCVAFPTLGSPGSLFLGAGTGPNDGVLSSITGTEIEYAAHDIGTPGGCTATNSSAGIDGVVIIRVPAENDKTGLPAGAFDTRTTAEKAAQAAKDKAKEKIRDKHTSPVTQEIDES